MAHDMILTGGRVVDASAMRETVLDVAIEGGVIAAIAPRLPSAGPRTIDVGGALVVPGLLDFHTHVFEEVCQIGLPPDRVGVQQGVTTVVDTGSSGAITFGALRRWVMEPAATRVLCFLNMGLTGIVRTLLGEMSEEGCYDPDLTAKVVDENRDRIIGIKVRATDRNFGRLGLEGLQRAKSLARTLDLPLLVHLGEGRDYIATPPFTAAEVLDLLDAGDILTHPFTARTGGVLQPDGRVTPALGAAVQRGVRFDLGHGRNNFSRKIYEMLAAQGFSEFIVSSDLNTGNINGVVVDLATTMSKFLGLGLRPLDVIRRVTALPAAAIRREHELGALRVGGPADITVLDLVDTQRLFMDTEGEAIPVRQEFRPRLVVRAGRLWPLRPQTA